ncbi:MAG TPA: MBL fold metallo-hydrolase [Desulfotomaculum sp.]|nr:MBL fold metallo-hydrolase [Desulfotomaculum sp.]
MKVTVVYDNEAIHPGLKADWGFSCLIETQDAPKVLFDTGASGAVLLHNMKKLGIDPETIGIVVISHPHGDHTGGLKEIVRANNKAELYLPDSFPGRVSAAKVTRVKEPFEICRNIFTTGELEGIEQSLAVKTDKGLLVIVGCSHPGVGNILNAAARFGKVFGILGGFHGFKEFEQLRPLSLICPCHCTRFKAEIRRIFHQQCLDCGAGTVIELGDG